MENDASGTKILAPEITNYKSEIIEIINSTNSEIKYPNYFVKVLEGEEKGKLINTYSNGITHEVGDVVYIEHVRDHEGFEYWNLGESLRIDSLILTGIIFMVFVVGIFGVKGLRSLFSLLVSLLIIFYILVPLTFKGYNPVLLASVISTLLLTSVMFITHKYTRVSLSALLGCLVSIFVTIIFSYYTIIESKITGFVDDTSSYLYYATEGAINFPLLIIASIIIGVIGVVDDGAITQARTVYELKNLNSGLTKLEYFRRAMRVGSDHAGAMINTLILAYIGSSLPVVLLFYSSTLPKEIIINKEIVATEIFRSLIGSVGLLLAIPLTTLFAVWLVKGNEHENVIGVNELHLGHKH